MSKRPASSFEESSSSFSKVQKKKLRTFTAHDETLAKIFDALASEDEKARVSAAVELLKFIAKTSDDAALLRIRMRLVRGLCSSRKGARIGFSLAFTEVVREVLADGSASDRKVIELLAMIKEQTTAEGSVSGQVC
jgi:DNA polymerase phi